MKKPPLKIVTLALSIPMTIAAFFFLWRSFAALNDLPPSVSHIKTPESHAEAKADPHGGGHPEAKADPHGGGHAEAKAEAKADPHGGGGEHGGSSDRQPASKEGGIGLVSIDEIFVNVGTGTDTKSLGLKLELELFDESGRSSLDKQQSGVKSVVIETSREQDSNRLGTIPGKLYFKETLISKLNRFFHEPLIRDVHFSTFYLQ